MARGSAAGLAGVVLAVLLLAGCGNSSPASHGHRHHARSSPSTTPSASASASTAPSPSPSASAPAAVAGSIDLSFAGGLSGTMTALSGQQCSLGTDLVDVALEGSVSGQSYWTIIDISDPGLGAGSWSVAAPASQRQGGLENVTPQVGPSPTSPTFGAAPGAGGKVTLSSSPGPGTPIQGSLSVTLLAVGSNHSNQSLQLSGTFSCPAS